MQKVLIINSSILLLVGTLLFEGIHKVHDHDQDSIENRCEECVIIDHTNNYVVLTNQAINFKDYIYNLELLENNFIKLNAEKKFLSRAPPIF